MYSHILFDLDDTLLDFQKAQSVSFNLLLKKFGIPFSKKIYDIYKEINHDLWHQFEQGVLSKDIVQKERFSLLFNALNKKVNGEEANLLYQENLSTQTWLIPSAKEICMKLSENHKLYIITNGVGYTQKKRFISSEIFPYFTDIFISEDVGVSKPDKYFFETVLNYINFFKKENILIVGDSISSDIQGANNIGIDCCWFNPNKITLNTDLKVTYTITDLKELLDII